MRIESRQAAARATEGVTMRITAAAATAAVTLALALFVALSAAASETRAAGWCQGSESVAQARRDLGVPVRVKARVVRAYWARTSGGRPTFLDLGFAYPHPRRLSLVIWGSDRVNFPRPPEKMFRRGTLICAQGIVSTYRGVTQMEVSLWDAQGRLLSF